MWEERHSDLSPVSPMALKPCEKVSRWSRVYVDGIEMSQQTENWHGALQGTPPQMGILEGQPRS